MLTMVGTSLKLQLACSIFLLSLLKVAVASLGIPCGLGPGGFGYDPNAPNSPDNWDLLDPTNLLCGTGEEQSPINIPSDSKKESKSKNPALNLKDVELKFECTNFNWELLCENVGNCGSTTFKGTEYDVVNQHFHSPSEHTLLGTQYPLEAHTVHRSANGGLLVIATLFKLGNSNSIFQGMLDNINAGTEKFDVDLELLVEADNGFCSYMGSLTTPPCTEQVTWLINLDIQEVSAAQVASYVATAGSAPFGNNRPLQPLNDREVTCFVGKDDDDDDDDEDDDDDDDDKNAAPSPATM